MIYIKHTHKYICVRVCESVCNPIWSGIFILKPKERTDDYRDKVLILLKIIRNGRLQKFALQYKLKDRDIGRSFRG
jgi:hypothetical protein